MSKKFTRILNLFAVFSLLFVFTACSTQSNDKNSSAPSNSATATGDISAATSNIPVLGTTMPVITQSAATQSPVAPSNTPTQTNLNNTPVSVKNDEVYAVHLIIKTEASEKQAAVEKFDDNYILNPEAVNVDLEGIKTVVFISDYRGNSQVLFFENVNMIVLFDSFKLNDSSKAVNIKEAEKMNLFISDTSNVVINWASNNIVVPPLAESGEFSAMKYNYNGSEIEILVKNLEFLSKDVILE